MQMEARELREFNDLEWEMLLEECLRILKKTKEEINAERKSAEWKLAIALLIKERTSARNGWIASRLNMGGSNSLSHNVGVFRREQKNRSRAYRALREIKGFAA